LLVLLLVTDMTAFADAMKKTGVPMDWAPSSRGYMAVVVKLVVA